MRKIVMTAMLSVSLSTQPLHGTFWNSEPLKYKNQPVQRYLRNACLVVTGGLLLVSIFSRFTPQQPHHQHQENSTVKPHETSMIPPETKSPLDRILRLCTPTTINDIIQQITKILDDDPSLINKTSDYSDSPLFFSLKNKLYPIVRLFIQDLR